MCGEGRQNGKTLLSAVINIKMLKAISTLLRDYNMRGDWGIPTLRHICGEHIQHYTHT